MAIDPDVAELLERINTRIDSFSGDGGHSHADSGSGSTPLDFGIRYVHPAGADSNDGYSTWSPKATLQATYDALPANGGTISLAANQRHDVGDGLTLGRSKRVAFTSPGRGARAQRHGVDLDGAIIYSSTGAPVLVKWTPPSGENNTYGFEFSNINFEISPTTTKVFEAVDVNQMRVVNCGAQKAAGVTNPGYVFIDSRSTTSGSNSGADASWWRVRDNYVSGGALVQAVGWNHNQWVIEGNVNFPGTMGGVLIERGVRCVIRDNNIESTLAPYGILLRSGYGNRIDGNAGERVDPWIILDASFANLITDMGSVHRTTNPKTFIRFVNGAYDNLIVVATGTGFWDLYNTAEWIDESGNGTSAENWFIAPSSFDLPRKVKLEP